MSQFNIVRTNLIDNETTPLQVGNGNFAFNVDNTGLQVCLETLKHTASLSLLILTSPVLFP